MIELGIYNAMAEFVIDLLGTLDVTFLPFFLPELQQDLQKAQIRQSAAQEALMYAQMARETEDKEQQKTLMGKIADLGFNTDIEKAEIEARRELNSANANAKKAQDQLEKLGTMGLQFNFKDVQKLYKDDPEGLKLLIERSISNQGKVFLNAQAQSQAITADAPAKGNTLVSDVKQTNVASTSISAGGLNVDVDRYHDKKAIANLTAT